MKKPNTYTLRIVGSHPKKLTLERMALYLAEMARLLGEKEKIHFDKLTTGSAAIRVWAEDDVAAKVETRLALVTTRSDHSPKDGLNALDRINDLLIQDGTKGELKNAHDAVIYPFPGGKRLDPEREVIVDQDSSITGQVIKIGGRDETIPVLVKDSDGREYNCTIMGAQLAKEVATFYLGDPIELSGKGRWKRTGTGNWELVSLRVRSWSPVVDDWDKALATLETIGASWSSVPDLEDRLASLRKGH